VTQDHVPGFLTGALFHLPGDLLPSPAQPNFALAAQTGFDGGKMTFGRDGPFRHDNHGRGQAQGGAFLGESGDLGVVEGNLRDEDGIGPAGQPAVEGDPAGMASHGFHHHDPLVGAGGGVEAVEAVDHAGDGGIESEGGGGGENVVVDGLGNADHIDSRFLKLQRRGEGTVPTDADEGMEVEAAAGIAGLLEDGGVDFRLLAGANLGHKAASVGGAEDGAAEVADMGDGDGVEPLVTDGIQQALIAVQEAKDLEAAGGGGGDHAVQNRVESGAVAAAGENANPFRCHVSGIRAQESGFHPEEVTIFIFPG